MSDTLPVMNILLVDPNVLFRCGIARLIESQPDMRVVGETGDGLDAIQLATKLQPEVILMELELIAGDGIMLAGLLHEQFPSINVVFLTTSTNSEHIFSCTLAGAVGYLHKNITPEELFARLRGLRNDEAALALTTVRRLMQRLSASKYTLYLRSVPSNNLTPREKNILVLVARGMTNREIGSVLQISEHTVRNHLCSICQKLGLQNRLQVAVYTIIHGLVDIDSVF